MITPTKPVREGKAPIVTVADDAPAPHAPVTQSSEVVPHKAAPSARDAAAPPRNTTADLWRDLHPARVWPD